MIRQSRPLRVAIYARYSSDLQNPSSVDDQVGLCRSLIADQFGVGDAIVFSDAAISGSTMERPGLARMVAAVEARRVDLVVAEGLDRLSRSLKDIAALYETFSYHGARMWTLHEGQISELHIGLKGTMNALMLRDLKARIKRGHRARIAAGFAASSCAYGYRVVRGVVDAKGGNVNGLREIDEAAAAVIRRVYQEYADGRTIPQIIAGLNRDGIPSAAGGLWKRNALMGGAQKQEGLLRNEIYIGKLIFNRSHVVRDPVTNRKKQIPNPEAEWTKVEVPHLRIIDDQTWERVRLRDCRRVHKEKVVKVPPHQRLLTSHNQHAITGWVKCGWCGGPKSLANESRYLCSTHRYAKSCKNSRGTKEQALMAAVFEALRERIEVGPNFRAMFMAAFAHETARREELQVRTKAIGERINRLLDAIENGVDQKGATARILELQGEQTAIHRDMQTDIPLSVPSEAKIRSDLAAVIREVELAGDVKRTRAMFKLLLSEIVLTPIAGQSRGETMKIFLRDEGWPVFWRGTISAEGAWTAPVGG